MSAELFIADFGPSSFDIDGDLEMVVTVSVGDECVDAVVRAQCRCLTTELTVLYAADEHGVVRVLPVTVRAWIETNERVRTQADREWNRLRADALDDDGGM